MNRRRSSSSSTSPTSIPSKRSALDDQDDNKHALPLSSLTVSRQDRLDTNPPRKSFDISELFSGRGTDTLFLDDAESAPLSKQHSFHSVEAKRSMEGHQSLSSSFSSELTNRSSNKRRIKWNPDLHEKFVKCVNQLGGPTKATPKAVLKLMEVDELSIFHVKSHLQKYRLSSVQARGHHEQVVNNEEQIHTNDSAGINQLMRLQDEVIQHLQEHLQIQTSLQSMVEEQNKQLQQILERKKSQ